MRVLHFLDHFLGRTSLVDVGYKEHFRANHGADQFVDRKCHIDGIESFWAFAKKRLTKFHGITNSSFYLHLNTAPGDKISVGIRYILVRMKRIG